METPQHCVLLQSTSEKPFMHINFWCNLQAKAFPLGPVGIWSLMNCDRLFSLWPISSVHSLVPIPFLSKEGMMLFWWTKQEPWALFQNCYKPHQTHSMSVPAAFFIWTVDGDKVHLSGQGKGNLSSHCFPNQRVEQLTPGADDSHAAWVKSVRCLSSSTIFCGFYGIPDAWPKQQIYSEGEAGPPFNSGLTW